MHGDSIKMHRGATTLSNIHIWSLSCRTGSLTAGSTVSDTIDVSIRSFIQKETPLLLEVCKKSDNHRQEGTIQRQEGTIQSDLGGGGGEILD